MKILIWGAGNRGGQLARTAKDGVEVVAFIDNNPCKQGTVYYGCPVIAKEDIAKCEFDKIVLSTYSDNQVLLDWITNNPDIDENRVANVDEGLFHEQRIQAMYQLADLIHEKSLGGATAELGVWLGDFAKLINAAFPDKTLHLFDTFEGFDENDIIAEKKLSPESETSHSFSPTSVELVRGRMPFPDNCRFHAGYFPDTAKGLEYEQFCFVSIDADLYKPIYDGLRFFYERLLPGGFIMVHDYYNSAFPGAKLAADQFADEAGVALVPIQDHGGSVVFGKR